MIRLLTAAALAALLATPVMAQSVSPGERSDTMQNQGSSSVPGSPPGSSSSDSMSSGSSGLSGQAPADCLPNDPRPACQTAQVPGEEPGASGSARDPAERSDTSPGSGSSGSGSWGGSGSSGSSGSSGGTGR